MKKRLIFSFFFSLYTIFALSQNTIEKSNDSWEYQPNFMVGIDVLNAAKSPFVERKLFKGFISSQIKGSVHAILEGGYDKNSYNKNGYDVNVNGGFLKLGGFYMLIKDREHPTNGFYIGGTLAGAVYQQEYLAIPIRGFAGSNASLALSPSTQSSYWTEVLLGGRVQLFNSPFYIDVNIQPKVLLYSTKQENIQPMIVAGFGHSSSKFTTGFSWNIAYKF